MITTLRTSTIRLIVGGSLALLGILIAIFVLPDASQKATQRGRAAQEARAALKRQEDELLSAQNEARRLADNREALEKLLRSMPAESVGKLHWKLSTELYSQAKKHGVRLVAVKYGTAAREGTKGSLLESLDVEFTATGIYKDLKPFMLALEGSRLPFAVVSAKLDESPDGAQLTVVLRAFRQITGPAADALAGEQS